MRIALTIAGPFVALLAFLAVGCRSAPYAERGAVLGGLAGAVTGAAIGENSGNAGAGAVIGTAVGALTGAAIGEGVNEEIAYNRALVEEQMGRRMAEAVTIGDVIAMSHASLSEDVIVTHIRAHGVAQRPAVNDLITLRDQGVTDGVIRAMQETPAPQPASPPPRRARPVIVEEHYYGPPNPWYWRHGPRHLHRHHCPSPGVRWGFSFGS